MTSSYLRGRLADFDVASRGHLESVAACYDRIAQLLAPAVTGHGGPHYRDFIGDLAKQKEHAQTVLVPVRQALADAAGEIEKALVVMEG